MLPLLYVQERGVITWPGLINVQFDGTFVHNQLILPAEKLLRASPWFSAAFTFFFWDFL